MSPFLCVNKKVSSTITALTPEGKMLVTGVWSLENRQAIRFWRALTLLRASLCCQHAQKVWQNNREKRSA